MIYFRGTINYNIECGEFYIVLENTTMLNGSLIHMRQSPPKVASLHLVMAHVLELS